MWFMPGHVTQHTLPESFATRMQEDSKFQLWYTTNGQTLKVMKLLSCLQEHDSEKLMGIKLTHSTPFPSYKDLVKKLREK